MKSSLRKLHFVLFIDLTLPPPLAMSQSKTTEDVADSTNSCVHYLSTCLDELRVIWNDVGIPPEQQIARVKVVSNEFPVFHFLHNKPQCKNVGIITTS